jgi:hypothetical protein
MISWEGNNTVVIIMTQILTRILYFGEHDSKLFSNCRILFSLVYWAHDWLERVGIQTLILAIKHILFK